MSGRWSTVEDALRGWLLQGSGLPADRVYFAHQDSGQPEDQPRISLRIGDSETMGLPELEQSYDGAQPRGQEIQYKIRAFKVVHVEVQAFANAATTPPLGAPTAHELLQVCETTLGLPGVRDALNAAGVGVLKSSGVRRLPKIQGIGWEDAAVLELAICIGQTATERLGYFETVNGGQGLTGHITE